MKRVLIVSDNLDLVSHFKCVAENISSDIADFSYSYSYINRSPSELKELGMSSVNMKDDVEIDFIIKSYDLVISVHCKQIFPRKLVSSIRCINVHPGLNPHNRGWYPQVFSILNKKPIGCTIHLMDEEIDHGDVIYQQEVGINSWDTSLDVYNRVVAVEKELISNNLIDLILGNYNVLNSNSEGNYNGISDFNQLVELNLSQVGSLSEHIDLLRALSHGDFKNAYFFDREGNKVFVRLHLEKEN
ncbi:dTDP-4-amino-4,6-dideoxyglucose formyltransferase [Shewanella gaetbuli]